uniref:WD repeat-containing protein 47 n=1 Tax=Syphacia muris TaxID=451379 RepID=A0A0N5ADA7_9BILA
MSNETTDSVKAPPSVLLSISEVDIVKVILEFLDSRGLHIAQLSLERETGIINGGYSDDVLFLRQLILDGQWDSALDFVEPLRELREFNFNVFRYYITKYKYFELLCLNQEPGIMHDNDFTVQELVECLKDLEQLCPTPEDFRSLCALLTLPKLSEHVDFKNWNPSSARIECFRKIEPMVSQLLPPMKRSTDAVAMHSVNDRLVQLLVKGIFYEGCVDFCQSQAIGDTQIKTARPSQVLSCRPRLCNNDLSLVNWLEAMDKSQYVLPFKQKSLDLKMEKIRYHVGADLKPKLEAQWTEHILATPVKPGVFPHSLVPTAKLKCAQQMSQSMVLPSMATSFSVALTRDTRKKIYRMSQSTAPMLGFSIEGSKNQGEAMMAQSQMIDAMFESSQYTKSTRPSNLHVSFEPLPSSLSNNESLQSRSSLSSLDRSSRRQLEDMAKSAQRYAPLPTVPELSTPVDDVASEPKQDPMTTSKLYQEFSNKQIQDSLSVDSRIS